MEREARAKKPWWRRSWEFWVSFVVYLGMQTAATRVITTVEMSGGWRLAVGLLPVIPLLFLARSLLRLIRQEDELYRRIQFEAVAIAAGTVIVLSFTIGFLEELKIIPHINSTWAAQVLILVWGISAGILTRRYG
jgi:hypothetical protein